MAQFVNDTFSGEGSNVALTAHTGETGASWTVISTLISPWVSSVNDNCYKPDVDTVGAYASGSPIGVEYDVEADISFVALTGTTAPGVCGRCSTSAQTFYMGRYNLATTGWQLYKVVSGSFTLLGSYSQSISAATAYAAKLEIRESAKKLYVDGAERISSSNNDITDAGKAGLRIAGSTDPTDARIDNFTATDSISTSTLFLDGKIIIKNDAIKLLDGLLTIQNIASNLLDGKLVIQDNALNLLDGKTIIKDITSNNLDGKIKIKDVALNLLDGKAIISNTATNLLDGKLQIDSTTGSPTNILDGKLIVKDVATNFLDGLIIIKDIASTDLDGKLIIKNSAILNLDGKLIVEDIASNLLDGKVVIKTDAIDLLDGKVTISTANVGLLDGKVTVKNSTTTVLDGKLIIATDSNVNLIDGKIIIIKLANGKVSVTFSVKTPSISFSMKEPNITFDLI